MDQASSSREKVDNAYNMESTVFDYEQLKEDENFGLKIFHKAIYKGILVDNSRNGNGVMVYHIGRIYEGHWMSDKR